MQNDMITNRGIQQYLAKPDITITILDTVTSTNTVAAKEAKAGAEEGRLFVANHQTSGRGRLGRSFFSPEETGIYMSLVLRPASMELSGTLTTMAAVSVCEAIEEVTGEKAAIKWVNDIFVNEKKVCGILTECSMDPKTKTVEYAVVGIGINVYEPKDGFPKELLSKAGAICKFRQENLRNRLIAECCNRFFHYYQSYEQKGYVEQYRSRSLVLGRWVTVYTPKGERMAVAKALDENCRLLVQYDDGQEEYLSSGEISISL